MEQFHLLVGRALFAALGMLWNMFWALVLGFVLSGIIQVFVSKKKLAHMLGKPGLRELGLATFFGAASSSCSYAAATMMKNLLQKGAHIVPAMAFLIASTNLVLELSLVIWALMGGVFVLAEFLGGILLVMVMAVLMKLFGPLKAMPVTHTYSMEIEEGSADPRTWEGWRQAAQGFVMEGQMIWKEIILGVAISGFLMVFVPDSFWQFLFLQRGHEASYQLNLPQIIENAFIGPLVSVLSFVCSVGNIPLASMLYHEGIAFSGALSFIYADLIVLPLILIYRKYYGTRLALWITGILYVSMVITGILVNILFSLLDLVPTHTAMPMMHEMHFFQINYTFWLNIVFLVLAIALIGLAKNRGKKAQPASCCSHE